MGRRNVRFMLRRGERRVVQAVRRGKGHSWCFREKKCTKHCAHSRTDGRGKKMPCEGEMGGWGEVGLVFFLPMCVQVSRWRVGQSRNQWERHVPGLQMAWHCCQRYDWHSLYCITHTVLNTDPLNYLTAERERYLEEGGRGESEKMQRLKQGGCFGETKRAESGQNSYMMGLYDSERWE